MQNVFKKYQKELQKLSQFQKYQLVGLLQQSQSNGMTRYYMAIEQSVRQRADKTLFSTVNAQ